MAGLDRTEQERLLAAHGAGRIIESIGPYLTDARRRRIEAVLAQRIFGVQVAIEAPANPLNAAAVVRTCEALGGGGVHLVAAEGRALKAQATTQGAFHWIETRVHASLDDFLRWVRTEQWVLAGAHLQSEMVPTDVPVERPICLLLGNEQRGLSARAVEACDHLFRVPMLGMSESLNLSVSAAISLYDVLRRRREHLGSTGDLDDEALNHWRALYYLSSVESRLARGLLDRLSQ